jgi:hypothetical protein
MNIECFPGIRKEQLHMVTENRELDFKLTEEERDTSVNFTPESVLSAAEDRRRGVSDNAWP